MKNMTMLQHFSELRKRLLFFLLCFSVAFCVGWAISPYIQNFLISPLLYVWSDATMLYAGLTDGLMIKLSLAWFFSLFVSIPIGLWEIWAFVAPGLHKNEKQFIIPIFLFSPVLFIIGAAFAFYVLFPYVFSFFIELNKSGEVPSLIIPVVKDYLLFAIGLLKIFGLAFQLPLVLILLNRIGVLQRSTVISARRYAIVVIVILAAVLTPPDVVSQLLLGIPMWILYELSILFMKREKKAD